MHVRLRTAKMATHNITNQTKRERRAQFSNATKQKLGIAVLQHNRAMHPISTIATRRLHAAAQRLCVCCLADHALECMTHSVDGGLCCGRVGCQWSGGVVEVRGGSGG